MKYILMLICACFLVMPLQAETKNYVKSEKATQLIRGNFGSYCFWYDPEWKMSKDFSDENKQDLIFTLEDCFWGNFRAQKIDEKVKTIDELRELFLEKISKFVSDVTVQVEEEREVNGTKMKYFQFLGQICVKPVVIDAYFYTNDEFAAVVTVSSFKEFHSLYERQIFDFLNGFVAQECEGS